MDSLETLKLKLNQTFTVIIRRIDKIRVTKNNAINNVLNNEDIYQNPK